MIGLVAILGFAFLYSLYKPNAFSKQKDFNIIKLKKSILIVSTYSLLFFFIQNEIQSSLFENYYTLISFCFFLLFLLIAYRYDNQSILSLSLTAFTLWIAFLISPKDALDPFANSTELNIAALSIGLVFMLISLGKVQYEFKIHFTETYYSFSLNLIGFTAFLTLIEGSLIQKLIFSSVLILFIPYFFYIAKKYKFLFLKINLYVTIGIFLLLVFNQDKMSSILELQKSQYEQNFKRR